MSNENELSSNVDINNDQTDNEEAQRRTINDIVTRIINESNENITNQDENRSSVIKISGDVKRNLIDLKHYFENILNRHMSFSNVLKILFKSFSPQQTVEIANALQEPAIKNAIMGTIENANKCEYKINMIRKQLEKMIPAHLLTEWVYCFCKKSQEAVSLFKTNKPTNPHCYSDDNITLLLKLLPIWSNRGQLKRHEAKKIERLALSYLAYSDFYRLIAKNIRKADFGLLNEAVGLTNRPSVPGRPARDGDAHD